MLRWFLKASFSTFWVKFGNTIQKFRFSFDPIEATENNVPSEKKLFTCNFHRKLPSNFLTTLISSYHFLGGDRRNLTPVQITNEINRSGDELRTISNTILRHLTALSNHDNLTRTRDRLIDLTPRTVIRPWCFTPVLVITW